MEEEQARLLRSYRRFRESEKSKIKRQRIEWRLDLPEPPQEQHEEREDSFPKKFAWERIAYAMSDFFSLWKSLMVSHEPPLQALVVSCKFHERGGYVSMREKRRNFVSGVGRSAGLAVITNNETRIWTDGGFFLEAIRFVDAWTLMRIGEDPLIEVWLSDNLPQDANIGVNSWSISIDTVNQWEQSFVKKNQRLLPITSDLVDPFEMSPVVAHPLDFAGRSVSEKLKDLRVNLKQEGACGLLITAPNEVAWIYNIHGTNHTFAIVTTKSAFLCVVKKKVSDEANSYFKGVGVEVKEHTDLISDDLFVNDGILSSFSVMTKAVHRIVQTKADRLWVDPASCCYALYCRLDPDRLLLQPSPLSLILQQ